MLKKLIAQGAEAKIYLSGDSILKHRVKKSYRLPIIDQKLRKSRTRSEAKLISTASRLGVPVPRVLDMDDTKMTLKIEYLDGIKLRDWLIEDNQDETKKTLKSVGKLVKKMHSGGIIHGDLTTSNMILKNSEVYFIDFGLGKFTDKIEDYAVDIHLLKECLKSKHHLQWVFLWKSFKEGYKDKNVFHQLELVESRARYKKIS